MAFSATPEIIEKRRKIRKENDEQRKVNNIKKLAETRGAQRLQMFENNLRRPCVAQDLRELQLIPIITR